jgi:hypothetical protein
MSAAGTRWPRSAVRRVPESTLLGRLRVTGHEWSAGDSLLGALSFARADRSADVERAGPTQGRLIRIQVTQPPGETVTVDYTDPDGAAAECRNTERADAVLTLQLRTSLGWEIARGAGSFTAPPTPRWAPASEAWPGRPRAFIGGGRTPSWASCSRASGPPARRSTRWWPRRAAGCVR